MLENLSWFMKYQPSDINDLIFDNDEHEKMVKNWFENERINGNVLFYGPPGLGKTASAEILIKKIIKSDYDLKICHERSANEMRDLKPFLQKPPMKSNQKIIYIEEFDKLHPDALNILKTGLMEKYQSSCSFIGCTNYIRKIQTKDSAILSRFASKLEFSGKNINGVFERLKIILQNENAKFNSDELLQFINSNITAGIRELINQLENSYIGNSGEINFSRITKDSGLEERIIILIKEIISFTIKTDTRTRKLCEIFPTQTAIADKYTELCATITNNYDIDYEYIYGRLYDSTPFIPFKIIINNFDEKNDFKKRPSLNLLECLKDLIHCSADMRG